MLRKTRQNEAANIASVELATKGSEAANIASVELATKGSEVRQTDSITNNQKGALSAFQAGFSQCRRLNI